LHSLEPLKAALAAKRLLVIGGLNVDQHLRVDERPVDDGSARISEYELGFGGHAGNCAVQLARLGANVSVLGAVGVDADGEALVADLESCGVDTSYICRLDGHHTGRVVIPTFPDCRYMLMYRGANEELDPDLVHLVTEFDAVVLFDPPLRFAEALLDFLERGPARPRLYWNPGGLLANSPWTRTRLACADVVIMNRVETRDAVGDVNESLLERLSQQRRGFRLIETMGREGSRLHAAGRTTAAASYAAKVIDETGAGDAFTAAFAAFDALDFDELVSLKLANAAGACAIEGVGARVAQPDLATLIGRWNLFGELSALVLSRGSYLGIAAV
jgi:ribokinase